MEIAQDDKHPNQEVKCKKKGGMKTMPFIIANETFEKAAAVGLAVNMILYLENEYHLSTATASQILFIWAAISYFLPLLGAFVSDSYMGRFKVIAYATLASFAGMVVLWLTAATKGARPAPCNLKNDDVQLCSQPNAGQLLFLFAAFALMSIGAGGIRPCSLAFGADQFNNPRNPGNERVLQSFFNWYYAAVGFSIMFSVTVLVAVQTAKGWVVGFGVPVVFMLVSAVMFLVGSPLYVKVKPDTSLFTGLARVVVAARKNRHFQLPPDDCCDDRWYYLQGSKMVAPSGKLRFLNKACLIRNLEEDLDTNGLPMDPWRLCTVRQVEELKVVIKVLPLWSTGIMVAVTLSQHSFPVLQADTMDRRVAGTEIPPGSFFAFAILTLTLWVAIYDRALVPIIARYTKHPRGLTTIQRMGIGLVISCVATTVAGLVEHKRRATAIRDGLEDHPKEMVNMSAMWLVPQQCLVGLAEAFNAIGQIDFYYSQFPKTMASIGVALFSLGFAVANLVGSLVVGVLNGATGGNGRTRWLANNLNKGHYDYYYWVLAGMCVINFFYFLWCSRSYGSCEDAKVWDQVEAFEDREKLELDDDDDKTVGHSTV